MRISLDWLKDFVEVNLPLAKLIEKLDMIGLMVEEWEEENSDIILDIETYANRPDTLGHLGVAREIAAALGSKLKQQQWPLTEIEEETSELCDVQIWNPDLCPRYSGLVVKGVKVGPSPEWLRKRIESMGLKPINNVVDVTNYVLFSTSHPIHAFDLGKLAGRKIIIRRAKEGESIKTLEEEDVSLLPDMLVIADEERPVAIAGVIGGLESSVQEETQDIFIESACFNSVSVRKTSKTTGISTDASYRFERGADVSFPPQAALMAASLMTQFGGKVSKSITDVYPKPLKERTVVLRNRRVFDLLGLEIDEKFTERTLSRLGFQVELKRKGVWQVQVPHFRVDVEREADLIEEIARFYGYDKIPVHFPPLRVPEPPLDQKREKIERSRQLLLNHGFDEVLNFSFSYPEREELLQTGQSPVEIRNPFSSKASLLRTTILGGLLDNIAWNKNRGADGVHLFELGNIYFRYRKKSHEQLTLSLVTTGLVDTAHWHKKSEKTDFFRLKGALEVLMTYLKYEPFSFKEEDHVFFENENSLALVFKEETIGYFGLLKKSLLDAFSLDEPVWAAELNLETLFGKPPQAFQYAPVTKFPTVTRDVSFIADQNISFQDIREDVEKLSLPYLVSFDLYDRFSGASIPKRKVSLSLRFVFSHPERTLKAEEVDKLQQKIIKALGSSFNFQLREGGKIDK
jgi:phenylalanyl-tRNA synthetase beta chain